MFNSMTKKSIPPRVIFVLLILAAFASLGGLRYAGYHFFPSSNDPHALLRCYYGASYLTPDHECDMFCGSCTKKKK